MKIAMVRCSFLLPVLIPDDPEWDAEFVLEENCCINTGMIGRELDDVQAAFDCWACALPGSCTKIEQIVETTEQRWDDWKKGGNWPV